MIKFLYFPALLSCLGDGGAIWAEGGRRGSFHQGVVYRRASKVSVNLAAPLTMGYRIDAIGREYIAVTEAKRCEKAAGTAEMAIPTVIRITAELSTNPE